MAMVRPFTENGHQKITGLSWSGPASNVTVRDAKTGKKLRLLSPQGNLIKEYKGGKR